jgi:hypothetical protein
MIHDFTSPLMTLRYDASQEPYIAVELASQRSNSKSSFFTDTASTASFARTALLSIGFLLLHIFAAVCVPPMLATREGLAPLSPYGEKVTNEVSVGLTNLQRTFRTVSVNCSFISIVKANRTLFVDVASQMQGFRDKRQLSLHTSRLSRNVAFGPSSSISEPFLVARAFVTGVDEIQLQATITSNFSEMKSLLVTWQFFNPVAERYRSSSQILLSILIAMPLLHSWLSVHRAKDSWTQVFLVLIGVTGVLATSPLASYLKCTFADSIAAHAFSAVFIAVLRLFFVREFGLLLNGTPSSVLTGLALIAGFAAYAVVDMAVSFLREHAIASGGGNHVLMSERMQMWADAGFALLLLALGVLLRLPSDCADQRRVWLLRCFSGLSLAVTAFADVICPLGALFRQSLMPEMLMLAVHGNIAAAALTFFRFTEGEEYRVIDVGGDAENIGLEVAGEFTTESEGF